LIGPPGAASTGCAKAIGAARAAAANNFLMINSLPDDL
jgi:hypothetical protein